jgi:hypothetical protein
MNKVKGRLGFPQKTKPPSGATSGGTPPKNGLIFFLKNLSQMYPVRLDPSSGRTYARRERLKGEKVRVGDSLRLQQDTALPPRLFAYKLLVRTNLSQLGFT